MTLPRSALCVWADAISSPGLTRTGATRYRLPFSCVVDLDAFADCDWSDAGFTPHKLRYLRRRYPPADLPDDGCIVELRHPSGRPGVQQLVGDLPQVVYRRVDVTRGWLADVLYVRTLGWRGRCRFVCDQSADGRWAATLHAVCASAVAPAVVEAGLWGGAAPTLARTLRRAIVHRLERRYESRASVRRVNVWAHRIASQDAMRETIRLLDAPTPDVRSSQA